MKFEPMPEINCGRRIFAVDKDIINLIEPSPTLAVAIPVRYLAKVPAYVRGVPDMAVIRPDAGVGGGVASGVCCFMWKIGLYPLSVLDSLLQKV